jgi:hypothetical protein
MTRHRWIAGLGLLALLFSWGCQSGIPAPCFQGRECETQPVNRW